MHIIDEMQDSIKEASYDKEHTEYMTESTMQVCQFDKVKEWYIANKIPLANPNPKSNDALYFHDEAVFFMEFKNGKIDNRVNFEINKKIYDSMFILFDLKYCDKKGNNVDSVSYTRKNMEYILVYNEEQYKKSGDTSQGKEGINRQKSRNSSQSSHRTQLYKAVRNLANKELILFGLDQFKNYLFKDVHTYTEEEFQKNFIKKYDKELQ